MKKLSTVFVLSLFLVGCGQSLTSMDKATPGTDQAKTSCTEMGGSFSLDETGAPLCVMPKDENAKVDSSTTPESAEPATEEKTETPAKESAE